MISVNYFNLAILSGFGMLSNEELAQIESQTDTTSKNSVQATIRKYILPNLFEWEGKQPGFLQHLKESLRYYLNTQKFPIEEVYDALEPAFEMPPSPIDFYIWCWELLFDGEGYHLDSLDGYVEKFA